MKFSVPVTLAKCLPPRQNARFSHGNEFQRVGLKPQVRECIILNLPGAFYKHFRYQRAILILLLDVFLVATVFRWPSQKNYNVDGGLAYPLTKRHVPRSVNHGSFCFAAQEMEQVLRERACHITVSLHAS